MEQQIQEDQDYTKWHSAVMIPPGVPGQLMQQLTVLLMLEPKTVVVMQREVKQFMLN